MRDSVRARARAFVCLCEAKGWVRRPNASDGDDDGDITNALDTQSVLCFC